jgi:hypothetical protein
VDMDRFTRVALVRIEEEPEPVVAKDRRHSLRLADGAAPVTHPSSAPR